MRKRRGGNQGLEMEKDSDAELKLLITQIRMRAALMVSRLRLNIAQAMPKMEKLVKKKVHQLQTARTYLIIQMRIPNKNWRMKMKLKTTEN